MEEVYKRLLLTGW